jgi:carbamoyl-phosphate synthase small subunit
MRREIALRASLLLEDGTFVVGNAHGARCERIAEIVFNTAMSGYEEVLTDPSYAGQFVLFTTSHIGNTGITDFDAESQRLCAEGFICRDFSSSADNWRSQKTLEEFLISSGTCAISDVDTRFLAQRLRAKGCMKAILSTEDFNPDSLGRKLKAAADISLLDLVSQTRSFSWHTGRAQKKAVSGFRVVAVDCGMKRGILDELGELGLDIHVVGPSVTLSEVEAIRPDGLFFSNGPGCPKQLANSTSVLELIKTLSPQLPTFGICLGHQLISLAFGGNTEKLDFGHHAVNHPVVSLVELAGVPAGSVMITSQNHNYHVIEDSVSEQFEITHRHMNDFTVAGIRHRTYPVFSVQFHPECNPGPRDAKALFSVFLKMLEEKKNASTL